MALCEFSIDQKWNLIYRASQDGFQYVNFHSKCDNKPNTFIIIKSALFLYLKIQMKIQKAVQVLVHLIFIQIMRVDQMKLNHF